MGFDDLARALAEPMPRRKALRILAGAAAGLVFSARAGAALGPGNYPCPKGDFECKCPSKNGLSFRLCCQTDSFKCECFSDRAQCTHIVKCRPGQKLCGTTCCDANEECTTAFFGNSTQYICSQKCPKGQATCGEGTCCPPGQYCLDPVRHKCGKCSTSQVVCGSNCCTRSGGCCDAKKSLCCRPGEKCGSWPPNFHICCKTHSCQSHSGDQPFCCPGANDTCVPQLDAGSSGFTPANGRVCCPPERLVTNGSGTGISCCPPGEVPAPGGKVVVGGGLGGVCCPESSLCGSGADATCCPTGRMCCDGQCIDVTSDAKNCGSCGHACGGTAVCRSGQCALA